MNEIRDIRGQTAIVTGAGRGLGREFALALAHAGARVAVIARTQSQVEETAEIIRDRGGQAVSFTGDATDEATAARVVSETEAIFGPADILVNNAGVLRTGGVQEVELNDWWDILNTNLKGPLIWTRAVLPGMIARQRGRVINISSGAAHSRHPYGSAYCASKAALSSLTRCMAPEVEPYGVSVIAFAPDALTDLSKGLWSPGNGMPPERREMYRAGFEADPEELMRQSMEMFMFIATGGADRLTGRHLSRRDTPEELAARADEIIGNDEYTIQRVPPPGRPAATRPTA